MKTLCFSRRTIGVAGLAALAFVVACSDDSTTSSTPDAASKVDATPGASDSSTPDAGGSDATAASDSQSVSEASTTDDSSSASTDGGPTADASDGGGSTDGGSSADGTIGDAGAMVDSAGDVVTAADVTTADVVGDAGSASNRCHHGDDVTSDVTTDDGSSTADAATDALGDASASPDSAAIVDGATDAGDAVAGALYTYTFDTSTEAWGNYGVFPFVGDGGYDTRPAEFDGDLERHVRRTCRIAQGVRRVRRRRRTTPSRDRVLPWAGRRSHWNNHVNGPVFGRGQSALLVSLRVRPGHQRQLDGQRRGTVPRGPERDVVYGIDSVLEPEGLRIPGVRHHAREDGRRGDRQRRRRRGGHDYAGDGLHRQRRHSVAKIRTLADWYPKHLRNRGLTRASPRRVGPRFL